MVQQETQRRVDNSREAGLQPEAARDVPYGEFKQNLTAKFLSSLNETERRLLKTNDREDPNLIKILDRYNEGRREQLKMWMEVNSLDMPAWQEKIIKECSNIVAEDVKGSGVKPIPMKVYLIPEELLPPNTAGWTMDEINSIVMVKKDERGNGYNDLISGGLSHHTAIHEAYHLFSGGFKQHRLEEGAAEWCSSKKLMDMPVSYQVNYQVDVGIVNELIGAIEKISNISNAEAEKIFKQAYFTGNKEKLKEIFGEEGWAKIESVAEGYNDPLLDQDELGKNYEPEMKSVIAGIVAERHTDVYGSLKLPPARLP
jgi:hypothetical protein